MGKYDQQIIGEVPMATETQMEMAIQASIEGFEALRRWSAEERSQHLHRLADLLEEKAEAFARLIVAEAGKPIGYARGEISRCLITLRRSAGEVLRFAGE